MDLPFPYWHVGRNVKMHMKGVTTMEVSIKGNEQE
jgi:hypothetical protein